MNPQKLGTPTAASRGAPAVGGGVYVHVPYCRRRCPYCDFYFEIRSADAGFAEAIAAELVARRGELDGPASSVSFGGGTPSALPAAQLADIVDAVRDAVGVVDGAEVSLEANPEDVTAVVARAWADAGVERVSLGVQSFDDDALRWLGRAHDGAAAGEAVRAIGDAGIARVGIDLIIGVPGDRDDRLARDVERAAALGVGHVSTYVLTVEAGTPLVQLVARGQRAPVDEDAQADAYLHAQALLAAAGYAQYEISSHARPGHESRHNRLYWAHQPYLGLGPGAHSLRERGDGGVIRRHNTARLDAWLPAPALAAHDDEVLEPAHALREAVAFGLRDLAAGVDVTALAARRRADPAPILAALAAAIARGEVVTRDEATGARRWHLTPSGARFADRVARDVLAAVGDRR